MQYICNDLSFFWIQFTTLAGWRSTAINVRGVPRAACPSVGTCEGGGGGEWGMASTVLDSHCWSASGIWRAMVKCWVRNWDLGEFHSGPVVVRTLCCHCWGPRFHPWLGNKDPASCAKKKEKLWFQSGSRITFWLLMKVRSSCLPFKSQYSTGKVSGMENVLYLRGGKIYVQRLTLSWQPVGKSF